MADHDVSRHRHGDPDRRPGPRPVAVTVAALAVVTFLVLAVLVETSWGPLYDLDRDTSQGLHAYAVAHPDWVTVMRLWTDLFDPEIFPVLALLVALWLVWRRALRLAAFCAVPVAVGVAIQVMVKPAIGRERPAFPDPVDFSSGNSLPSGHALMATVTCGVLLLLVLPHLTPLLRAVAGTVAVVVAAVTGFTRVALGVHWVSDVLAGWILGVAVVAAAAAVFAPWRRGPTWPRAGLPEIEEHHR
jgi:membrane-associated phospholipid phosphatase